MVTQQPQDLMKKLADDPEALGEREVETMGPQSKQNHKASMDHIGAIVP